MRLGRARGGGERALRPGAVRSARAARSGNPPPGPPRCSLGAGSARARQSAGKAGPGLPGRGLSGAATGAARGGGKRSGGQPGRPVTSRGVEAALAAAIIHFSGRFQNPGRALHLGGSGNAFKVSDQPPKSELSDGRI